MRFSYVVVVLVALPLAVVVAGDEPDGGLGSIFGIIVDQEFQPLENANVTLRELDLMVITGANGHYAFNGLDPATYTVYAKKPGYQASGRQVTVAAGQAVHVDLILVQIPPPPVPYRAEYQFEGLVGCSVAAGLLQGGDLCDKFDLDANANADFGFAFDSGATALVVVVHSSPGPLGEAALLVEWLTPVAAIPALHGYAPLRGEYAFGPGTQWTAGEGPGRFHVKADPHTPPAQLAYQQEVQVYLGVFYNGEPVPPGYSPIPDA